MSRRNAQARAIAVARRPLDQQKNRRAILTFGFVALSVLAAATASHENGLLDITLVREVPEALKPRQIEIGKPAKPAANTIEGETVDV